MPDATPATAPTTEVTAPPATEEGNTLPDDNAIVEALEKGGTVEPAKDKAEPAKAKETPKKEPDKPKESAVLRSIQKREQDLVRDRANLAAEKQALQASITQQIQAGVQEALKKQFGDPREAVKNLKAMGLLPNQIAQALVNPEAPTTEELAKQALQEARDLKTKLENEAKARSSSSNEQEFLTEARKFKDQFKELHIEWTEPEILTEAYRLAAELRAECEAAGKPLPNVSNESVLRVLNKRAQARMARREEILKAKEEPAKAKEEPAKKNGVSTTTLGKNLGERQSIVTTDPVLMSNDDIIKQVEKQIAEGVNIKAR